MPSHAKKKQKKKKKQADKLALMFPHLSSHPVLPQNGLALLIGCIATACQVCLFAFLPSPTVTGESAAGNKQKHIYFCLVANGNKGIELFINTALFLSLFLPGWILMYLTLKRWKETDFAQK